jgi:hypothetical protein
MVEELDELREWSEGALGFVVFSYVLLQVR